MTDDRLAEIEAAFAELRRLKAAATPGPWEAAGWNLLPNCYLYGPAPLHEHILPPLGLMKCRPPMSFRHEDAMSIAGAHNTPVEDYAAELVAEVRRLRAENNIFRENMDVAVSAETWRCMEIVMGLRGHPLAKAQPVWDAALEMAAEAICKKE